MIDVAISSCARVNILKRAVESFLEHVKSKEGFRLIICEDKVDDPRRQEIGKNWLKKNSHYFDEIIYSETKLTYVFCFTEILKYVKSNYFFRLEDDVVFDQDIDVDEIVAFMSSEESLSQLIFKRSKHTFINAKPVVQDLINRKIIYHDFCSIATGVFNTRLISQIVHHDGSKECHESSILTPVMEKLKLKSGVIHGIGRDHALKYLGDTNNLRKGAYEY